MFLMNCNVCFGFVYACFMCSLYVLGTTIWHLVTVCGTRSFFFWWRQVGNPVKATNTFIYSMLVSPRC